MKKTPLKMPPIKKLIKECDALFSKIVRIEESKNGIGTCYTCGYQAPIKKMHCGHLVSRYYKATRWDRRNCRTQCPTCNIWRNGMTPHFAEKLKKELGNNIVEELYQIARKDCKLTPEHLLDLKEKLTVHLRELETTIIW